MQQTPEQQAELRRIAEAATQGLVLTPEMREQLQRLTEAVESGAAPVTTNDADFAARAFREIKRMRAEMERLHGGQARANRVRFYLRRVTDYAMHDFEPVRYMHIEAEVPALAEVLRREQKYPWHVVGVELVEERDDDD